ncbi:MAG: hypothetical protein NC306_09985, partial [Butyrivibrio sp.]|nr:hypothetical protein [Butyrivibrio sp.]
ARHLLFRALDSALCGHYTVKARPSEHTGSKNGKIIFLLSVWISSKSVSGRTFIIEIVLSNDNISIYLFTSANVHHDKRMSK